jgi:sarcosine oxidase subunit beta
MPDQQFDIVIVGAGIIGTSIAWHVARRGASVAVVEREINPGMGSTSKAAGGIRAQFSSEINIELSRLSIEAFERFPKEMGVDVAFRQAGYLWIATKAEEMAQFRRNVALQQKHGLDVRLLDRAGVGRLAPYARLDDVEGGTFHAKDGYAPPADYVMGYHKNAKERGAKFFFGLEVTGIRDHGVVTRDGIIGGRMIVCAAGAWSGRFGEMLGVEVPIVPVRRQCFVTEPIREGLRHPIPMTIDYTTGIYLHSESGGVLVGKAKKDQKPGFDESVEYAFIEEIAEQAMHRVPLLETAAIRTSWGGLYEVTPDHHPILGEIPGKPGFYIAAGFSGHGVMHAPATGQVMAEILLDGRAKTLDVSCLRFARFREGALIRETHVI